MKWRVSQFVAACALLACAAITDAAHFKSPPAALVVLTRGTTADEFSPVIEFTKVEFESPVALKVELPDGQSHSIPKNQIAQIFWYPDPAAPLSGPADVTALTAKRSEAVTLASRFPNTRTICERLIAGIDSDVQKLATGQVRYRGAWQSGVSAPSASPAIAGSSDFASLTIAGTTYTHVTIGRLENGSVQLQHDGGVVRVPLDQAPPELLSKLQTKPSLTRSYLPMDELPIANRILTHALLAGDYGETIAILHDGGVEITAKSSVTAAQFQALLATIPPKQPSAEDPAMGTRAAGSEGVLVMGPGEGTPAPEKGWRLTPAEKSDWEAASRAEFSQPSDFMFFKNLLGGKPIQDPAVDPARPIPHAKDSLAFINTRIAPHILGYNETNRCLVLCSEENGRKSINAAFKALQVNATVRFKLTEDGPVVILEGRDMAPTIDLYTLQRDASGGPVLWHDCVTDIQVPVSDLSDAQRVARAFSYLIITMGGRSSAL